MLDEELRALVSVEPPQGFEARVRATIAAQPALSPWWQVRRFWLVPAAIATGLVIAAWLNVPVEGPKEAGLLQARATAYATPSAAPVAAALPAQIASRSLDHGSSRSLDHGSSRSLDHGSSRSLHRRSSASARLPVVQFDAAESRALQALFSSTPAIAIVTIVPPEDAPIVIPGISIAPLVAVDSKEGDRQ